MLRLHHIVETTGGGLGDLVSLDEAREAPVHPGGDWLYELSDDAPGAPGAPNAAEAEAARGRPRAFAVRRPDRSVIDMIGARLAATGRRRQGLAYSKFPVPERVPRPAGLQAGLQVGPGRPASRPPPLPAFRKDNWSAMSVISAAALTLMFVSGTALAVVAAFAA